MFFKLRNILVISLNLHFCKALKLAKDLTIRLWADDALLKFIEKGLNPIVYMQNHRMKKKLVYLSLFANCPRLKTVKNCINVLFIGHLNTSCFNVFRVYNNNKVEILSRV